MANRSTALRGFTCAVAHVDPSVRQSAGLATGLDDDGADIRVALSLRHADGTMMVAYLTEDGVQRLADRLARLVAAAPMTDQVPAGVTLQ